MSNATFQLKSVIMGLILSACTVMAQTAVVPFPQQTFSTGMVPLASNQTAQLNVLNLGTATCFVQVSFYDSGNNLVGKASPILNVASGHSVASTTLGVPAVTAAQRPVVRGVVRTEPNPTASSATPIVPVAACSLMITLETFDYLNGPTVVFTSDVQPVATPILVPGSVK